MCLPQKTRPFQVSETGSGIQASFTSTQSTTGATHGAQGRQEGLGLVAGRWAAPASLLACELLVRLWRP